MPVVLGMIGLMLFAWVSPAQAACDGAACEPGLPGDFDNDGDVDGADFALLHRCQDRPADANSDPLCVKTDLNGDGVTDSTDFALFQENFTGPCTCGPFLKEPLTQSLTVSPAFAQSPHLEPESIAPPVPDPDPSPRTIGDPNPMYQVWGHSGEFRIEVTDLRIRGRGMDLAWTRTYRSRSDIIGPMGRGWDHSYNVWIEPAGRHIRLHNGHGRSDVLLLQPDGTWTRRELFAVLEKEANNGFTLSQADGRRWKFRPLDGSAAAGRIDRIADRNGNAIAFSYNGDGRLTTVHDTLDSAAHDRDLSITYNDDGAIESITDFAGRRVIYGYYRAGDSDGGAGDLASVTGPEASRIGRGGEGTAGKPVIYTYSRGFEDERLNHNLLTITDAKGQTWITNTYGQESDTSDSLQFDRVIKQVYGGSGDRIDTIYRALSPTTSNGLAVTQATIKDRAGNVRSFFYDARNRLVLHREYTGRADRHRVMNLELGDNLAGKPLRETDPAYFETRYEYNDDSLCTRMIEPEGDVDQYVFDTMNPNARSRGRVLQHVRVAGRLGGDQRQLVETFEYDANSGRVSRRVNPRGEETRYGYDETGNCLRVEHALTGSVEYFEYNAFGQVTAQVWPDYGGGKKRRDEFAYYAQGRSRGMLESRTLDAAGAALTTTYRYDGLDRPIRKIDPKGADAQCMWNGLDRIVYEASREATPGSGLRRQRSCVYDANGNLAATEIGTLDEQGQIDPDSSLTTMFDYDILNAPVRQIQRAGNGQTITTEYAYDDNHNLSLVRVGEAASGRQPANTIATLYDERDLPFRVIRATGDPAQSSVQYDYDGDRRLRSISKGLESENPHVTTMVYDGFGRLLRRTDAMGNEESRHYDAAGSLVALRFDGETNDVPGGQNNVRLSETLFEYDELNRRTRKTEKFFDPQTQTPFEDGEAVTRYEYTDAGQVKRVIDDLGNATSFTYDALGHRTLQTDARGNMTAWTFDAASNLVGVTQTDRSDLGRSDRSFSQTFEYDGLGRLARKVDSAGHAWKYLWDGAGHCVMATEPRGRQTRYVYDGMGRLIQTIVDMNRNGPNVADAADIAIAQKWDDSNRLIAQTDANLNTTSYSYDPLGRLIATRFADGTIQTNAYDVFDDLVTVTDPTGTVIRSGYDRLHRCTNRTISRGSGIGGAAAETYAYDGRSRVVNGTDDDSAVSRQYDSLGNLLAETQAIAPGGNTRAASATYNSLGRRLTLHYPGGRLITASYDALGRAAALRDESSGESALIAAYSYLGPDRIERRDFGNGLRLDVSYDEAGRPSVMRYGLAAGGAAQLTRSWAWDASGNCVQAQTGSALGALDTRIYLYDAANRLVGSERMVGAIREAGIMGIGYTLDGAGNRTAVTAGPDAGVYLLDPSTPEPADLQMNQYTAAPGQPRSYDRSGNLITAGTSKRYTYDYRGQLTELTDLEAGLTVLYKYDVFGRRIEKNVAGNISRHYYFGSQEIEEQSPSNITTATFVHPVLEPDREVSLEGGPLQMTRGSQRLFLLGDALGSCLSIVGASGAIVEQYDYADFGRPAITDAAGATLAASVAGNPYLFRGCRYDLESGLYLIRDPQECDRSRTYDPAVGRLTSRAVLNPWVAPGSLGNPNTLWNNNPMSIGSSEPPLPSHGQRSFDLSRLSHVPSVSTLD